MKRNADLQQRIEETLQQAEQILEEMPDLEADDLKAALEILQTSEPLVEIRGD
ncbi:DUF433 domain-containing protein [Nodularia sp. NIES-3585]|uniref:DUF433 domain-containing protein n=1 Tax=Nodularia sp. NIES-3585 TaxID=1973477 RepID=UPI000B69D667|nr:DUF433 domain-containing protein [Nodularia sp. NIES-3585]GAX35790.1 hypothetical protein NIES3585_18080 [Nodularia sp. NIES-3585]